MDKFSFISLWDAYSGLLTHTQQEITDLYFNKDLTVSEIAVEKGISRQAVSDCLKGCKKQLEEYEEKLHYCRRMREYAMEVSFMTTDADKWIENFKTRHPELAKEVEKLSKILSKDYSAEVKAISADPESMKILTEDYTAEVYGRPKTGEE